MIVWLASYPRSGNTLLRTIFKKTMDIGSYSDELLRPEIGLTDDAKEAIGHLAITESWESFYEKASASKDTYLVKTHLPPRDNQPVIYVIRDGRKSLVSYHKYHQQFFPEHPGGLIDLILGADYYGDWSTHYANWMTDKRKVMLLHYEDLVNVSSESLLNIAKFIGHNQPITKWSNEFGRLQNENPHFFRAGKTEWQGAKEWTDLVNGMFFLLHGDLMNTLGYVDQAQIEQARTSLTPDLIELVRVARSIQGKKAELEQICLERLSVIKVLDDEVQRLSGTWRWLHGLFNK